VTNRERFDRVMSFQPVERLPNYEFLIWPQTVERWIGEGMPEGACNDLVIEGAPYFGIEPIRFGGMNTEMAPPFTYEVFEETEKYVIARGTDGVVTKALKAGTVRGWRMCMDQYLSFPVTDRKSFAKLKQRYDPTSPERYPKNWDEQVKAWQHRDYPLSLAQLTAFGLYSQLRSWVGTEGISYLFFDDPALVEEMIEFKTEFFLAVIEKALNQVQFDFFDIFEDFAGKGGPLISPQTFRKFFLPYYQRVTGRLRRAGIKHVLLDSDGDPEVLIPLMLEAGVTALWPLEQASGMDPVRLRRKFGRTLGLLGGIDKREIAKDKKAIEAELETKIPPLLDRGGYIPFIDHAIPPDVSYSNFLCYLEAKTKLIGMESGLARSSAA